MQTLHSLLIAVYLALPVAAAVIAATLARRSRSHKPLTGFGLSILSAGLISTFICLVYARAVDGTTTAGQIFLLTYLLTGVMTLLKGLSWALKEGSERLLFVHASQPAGPRGVGWAMRLAASTVLRVVFLFAIGLPYIMSLGLVYRPKAVGGETPTEQFRAPYSDVSFESTDGVRLAGWWIPALPKPPAAKAATAPSVKPPSDATSGYVEPDDWGRKTVILCHGLGASKGNQLMLARDLVVNGYNVLAFDFRAHGESGGQLCSFGDRERYDVLGAVRWLRKNHPVESKKLVGLGISMGGAALLAAAAEPTDEGRAIDAIAVFSTYDDFKTLAKDVTGNYFISPLGSLMQEVGLPLASLHAGTWLENFSPARAAADLAPRPLMVVHGRGDNIIPFDTGVRLFDKAHMPKVRLWVGELDKDMQYVIRTNAKSVLDENGVAQPVPPTGPPADHNNLIYYDGALKAVRFFFDEAMPVI